MGAPSHSGIRTSPTKLAPLHWRANLSYWVLSRASAPTPRYQARPRHPRLWSPTQHRLFRLPASAKSSSSLVPPPLLNSSTLHLVRVKTSSFLLEAQVTFQVNRFVPRPASQSGPALHPASTVCPASLPAPTPHLSASTRPKRRRRTSAFHRQVSKFPELHLPPTAFPKRRRQASAFPSPRLQACVFPKAHRQSSTFPTLYRQISL